MPNSSKPRCATRGLLRFARNDALETRHTYRCHHPRKRVIQYSEASVIDPKGHGVLDIPLEPVIGLAEGETRWRGMTANIGEKRKRAAYPARAFLR